MTEINQLQSDLAFVSDAVRRHERTRPDLFGTYLAWAIYIVVGYTLLDFSSKWANIALGLGWIPATIASWWSRRRTEERGDLLDPEKKTAAAIHFGGGVFFSIAAAFSLAAVYPELRGPISGQLIVVLIGMVYFIAGAHFDRRFLVLGPAMIAGAICLKFVPRYPWTLLGLMIAAGLLIPSFFKRADHVEQE